MRIKLAVGLRILVLTGRNGGVRVTMALAIVTEDILVTGHANAISSQPTMTPSALSDLNVDSSPYSIGWQLLRPIPLRCPHLREIAKILSTCQVKSKLQLLVYLLRISSESQWHQEPLDSQGRPNCSPATLQTLRSRLLPARSAVSFIINVIFS